MPIRARQWWITRTQQQKLLISGGGAFALALAFGGWELSQQTDYAIVYSGLSPSMGGNIIAALQKDNVPFRLLNNGDLIEVPKADAARVRLQLAEQGLPARATSTLWNQLQNEKLGTSSFVEHTTYLRALESGLARDIRSIHGVESASVTLAIPRHTPFLERMPVPKAAVTLHLMPGVTLSHEQVFGITHLVASSVPGLHASQVTVVDQSGQALTAKATGAESSTVLQLQRSVEKSYQKQVVALLSPLVGGAKNLRVIVDANIDLSHHQESSITYGMGHVVTAAVQSSADKGNMSATAFGIPGALSNQPPGAPSAPITAGATSAAPQMSLAEIQAMMPRSSKDQQHFHYVLDKTVGFRKGAPWRLRTLSISVLVNGKEVAVSPPSVSPVAPTVSVGKKGKPAVSKTAVRKPILSQPAPTGAEFTPQVMTTLKKMVSNAIHASAPQGTIDIAAIPFRTLAPPPPLSWWQKISPWAVWHQIEWFLLGLIALFL
ncbi:flagellar M-ring protein FliF, partial [Acidithiobacillus thiooxidans]|uniref:flagellar basal-body MS-ring/collar protein FliF n=1 Tax=Acidithiobacillus thiooxidans TaxID=930 RepID=UPI001C07483B